MIKTRRFILLALSLILLSTTAYGQESPIRVACVGNSITQGFGLENPGSDSYPAQLAAMLGEDYEVGNFGQPGRTMLRKGDFPYWDTDSLGFKDALAFNPDMVILMFGGNDTRAPNWTHKDEFFPDYVAMIDTFAQLPAAPNIFICLPPPILQPMFGLNPSLFVDEVLPLIDSVATAKALPLIDIYSLMLPFPELYLEDGVHPDPQGAQMIASEIASALLMTTSVQNANRDYSLRPKAFKIYQNYPNPFNPRTTIRFLLMKDSNVKLTIFNLLGERIKTLVDGYQSVGEIRMQWDGTDFTGTPVSSGLYLYQLKAGNEVKVRRMLLTK